MHKAVRPILRNRRGISLIEVLAGTGLAAATALVAAFLAITFYRYNSQNSANVESEIYLLTASRDLHRALSMAADISLEPGSLDGVSLVGGQGKIRNYIADVMGPTPGQIETVAVFMRESGGPPGLFVSKFISTGIFYARPSPKTSGVLFIVSEPGGGPLTPKYSDLFYGKIVEFYISNFYYTRGVLTSVEFSITARRFLDSDVSKWTFCPQKDIVGGVAGCTGTHATFRDVVYKTRVTFSNQVVRNTDPRTSAASAPYERLLGNIYLFPQR